MLVTFTVRSSDEFETKLFYVTMNERRGYYDGYVCVHGCETYLKVCYNKINLPKPELLVIVAIEATTDARMM